MSRYAAGRRKEWECRKELRKHARLVIRSAGSKGYADLIAFYGRVVMLVQVKYARPGRPWKDANWKMLCNMLPLLPENVAICAYVYRRGVRKPEIHRGET